MVCCSVHLDRFRQPISHNRPLPAHHYRRRRRWLCFSHRSAAWKSARCGEILIECWAYHFGSSMKRADQREADNDERSAMRDEALRASRSAEMNAVSAANRHILSSEIRKQEKN